MVLKKKKTKNIKLKSKKIDVCCTYIEVKVMKKITTNMLSRNVHSAY